MKEFRLESRSSESGSFDISGVVDRTRTVGRQLINQQIDQRSTLVGKQISDTAQAVREVGSDLQKRGQGRYVADITDAVATYIERVGRYLQESDSARLGHDFETLARRQPVLVGAFALVGGFASSRVLRVSSTLRPQSERQRDVAAKSGTSS